MIDRRAQIVLELLGARVADIMAEQALTQAAVYLRSGGHVSSDTVSRVLRARDCRLSKLIAIAGALECEIEITLKPKVA